MPSDNPVPHNLTYKLGTGAPSELRRELKALKKAVVKLESLKSYVGPATYNNILFEFNKNVLPRIKELESMLSLNVSTDYVDSEISEMGKQIAEKYGITEDVEIPIENVVEEEDTEEEKEGEDFQESKYKLYEVDNELYYVDSNGEIFRIDFPDANEHTNK